MSFLNKTVSIIKRPFLFIKGKWNSMILNRQLKGVKTSQLSQIESDLDRIMTTLTSPTIATTTETEITALHQEKKELIEKLTLIEIAEISKPKNETQSKQKFDLTYLKQEIEPINSKIREIKQKRNLISKINIKEEYNSFSEIFEKVRKHLRRDVKTFDYSSNNEGKKLQKQIDDLLNPTALVTAFHIKEKRRKEENRIKNIEIERTKREQEKKRKDEELKKKKEQSEQKKKLEESLKELIEEAELKRQEKETNKKRNRELLAENGTHYEILLRNRTLNSFDNIIALSSNQGDIIFNTLESGIAILQEQQQLEQYIASYGRMHKLKLIEAFDITFKSENITNTPVNIIDWGCGQALATCVLIDHLQKNEITSTITSLTLFEPSVIATQRGVLHLNKLINKNHNPNISVFNTYLDSVTETNLVTDIDNIKIHLFSNILDVPNIDLHHLFRVISNSSKGYNLFICVSPNINEYRNSKLDRFMDYFLDTFPNSSIISERDTPIPNPTGKKSYKRYEKIFKVFIPQP